MPFSSAGVMTRSLDQPQRTWALICLTKTLCRKFYLRSIDLDLLSNLAVLLGSLKYI